MSGLILPDELDELGVDVSVPAFVFVKPDGSIGINYVQIKGEATITPPAYWGQNQPGGLGSGPIVPQAELGGLDWIDLVALVTPSLDHTVLTNWRCLESFDILSDSVNWIVLSDSPLYVVRTASDVIGSNATWVLDTLLGTITIPYTGYYRIEASAWWTASAAGAQTSEIGFWRNGAIDFGIAGEAANASLQSTIGNSVPGVQLNAGDVVGLALWNNEPIATAPTWNVRSLRIYPEQIANVQ